MEFRARRAAESQAASLAEVRSGGHHCAALPQPTLAVPPPAAAAPAPPAPPAQLDRDEWMGRYANAEAIGSRDLLVDDPDAPRGLAGKMAASGISAAGAGFAAASDAASALKGWLKRGPVDADGADGRM